MRGSTATRGRTGLQGVLAAAAVWSLPLLQYAPLSKWMAVSLFTLRQLDPSRGV